MNIFGGAAAWKEHALGNYRGQNVAIARLNSPSCAVLNGKTGLIAEPVSSPASAADSQS